MSGEARVRQAAFKPGPGVAAAASGRSHEGTTLYGLAIPLQPTWLRPLRSPAGWLLVLGAGVGLALVASGYATRGVIVLGIGAATAASLTSWRRGDRSLHAALVALGLFATLVPEVLALKGDIGRMNTVFKLYMQAWVLLAVAGAVALAWLVAAGRSDPLLRRMRGPWLVVAIVLAVAAFCYPLFATQGKVGLRFTSLPLTLDGMAFMDHARYADRGRDLNLPADAEAIRWLRATVQGSPVILEGRTPLYRWGSRVSIYTGLPTVLGWDWHEQQQRAAYVGMIQQRAADVQRAYDSPAAADALAVIHRYGVRWVYVGGLERAYYSAAGLAKLARMPELRLAYDRDGVQIYEVLP